MMQKNRTNDDNLAESVTAPSQDELDRQVKQQSGTRTRRSFLVAGAVALGGVAFYEWIARSTAIGRQELPLRRAFETNASLARGLFREAGLAPTYALEKAARELRLNGNFGLRQNLNPESWRLQLVGVQSPEGFPQYSKDVTSWRYEYAEDSAAESIPEQDDSKGAAMPRKPAAHVRGSEEAGLSASGLGRATPGLLLTMGDLQRFAHVDMVTEFKCIEGWSEIVHWGGVRLADLIAAYPPAKSAGGRLPRYVYMETPDGDYYCGYDMSACTHPQSLLVYEMSGRPIERWHGAPLRLHMPIKYGYKQIKRIGLIAYTDLRPDDYWTKLGYDWYAGL